MLSFVIFGTLFIFLGLGIHVFKWHFLISGYNTMSKEKKAKVDIEGLARLFGIYSYINGSVLILAGILYGLGLKFVIAPAIIIFIVMTISLLIKAQKFDGNIFDEAGKLRKGAGKQYVIPLIITFAGIVFVAVLLTFSSQSTKVTFQEDGIQIHGMYGEIYRWEDIKTVKLMDELPNIELRTNGSALGSKLKGYFRTTELGSVKLFVNTKNPPFIYLETESGITIFNIDDKDDTNEIYMGILNKID
ncbi:MAG: DUF3784 domain-containing protein [Anaerolineaceae bacterium]|nr:MAG: DUF3784 domain-containing protein [Anaerolineaceae bacterium]